jgi:hypothetical protein
MNLFSVAAGWWSVAGLAADMAGVAILTYDLLPDYRLYKARRAISEGQADLSELEAAKLWLAKVEAEEFPEAERFIHDARLEHARFKIRLAKLGVGIAIAGVKARLGEPYELTLGGEGFEERSAQALEALKNREAAERNAGAKKRPPLLLGVFLILCGFALQMVGSIPM